MQTGRWSKGLVQREKEAQLTENDIQLIYFQFSEIMSAIKMLVVRRGKGCGCGCGQVVRNLAGCIRERLLQCGMKLTLDDATTTGAHVVAERGSSGLAAGGGLGAFYFALTATNRTMK